MEFTTFYNAEEDQTFYEVIPKNHDNDEIIINRYADVNFGTTLFALNYYPKEEILQLMIYYPDGRRTYNIGGFLYDQATDVAITTVNGRRIYEAESEYVNSSMFLDVLSVLNKHATIE